MRNVAKGLAVFVGILSLKLIAASARGALAFALVGLLYLLLLFTFHPELTNDDLALSVIVVLGCFWGWCRAFFWMLRRFRGYREMEPQKQSAIGKTVTIILAGMLFAAPSFAVAGLVLMAIKMSVSANTAFFAAKETLELAGGICGIVIITAVLRGRRGIPLPSNGVNSDEPGATFQNIISVHGVLSQTLRAMHLG